MGANIKPSAVLLLAVAAAAGWAPVQAAGKRTANGTQQAPAAQNQLESVSLRDVHPLYGGQILYLAADGSGYCQLLSRREGVATLFEKRYQLPPSPALMERLARLLAAHSFTMLSSSQQPGLPDASRPALSVRMASGQAVTVRRWLRDGNQDFEAVYQAMLAVAQSAPAQKLVAEGRFDMDWVPPGFEESKKN